MVESSAESADTGASGAAKKVVRRVAPKKRPAASRTAAAEAKRRQARVVKNLLKKMEDKLSEDEVKATLGDYIRLVQLQKDLEEEQPKEIKVTWVEPTGTESDSGK